MCITITLKFIMQEILFLCDFFTQKLFIEREIERETERDIERSLRENL